MLVFELRVRTGGKQVGELAARPRQHVDRVAGARGHRIRRLAERGDAGDGIARTTNRTITSAPSGVSCVLEVAPLHQEERARRLALANQHLALGRSERWAPAPRMASLSGAAIAWNRRDVVAAAVARASAIRKVYAAPCGPAPARP